MNIKSLSWELDQAILFRKFNLMKTYKLWDITTIKTGKLDANARVEQWQYPFFTCSKEISLINTFSYDCECILVAWNWDLNVKYYHWKFDAYQRTYIIEHNWIWEINMRYLYFFMSGYLETLRSQTIWGVIQYIKMNNLTDIKIPLPPIPQQQTIATHLDHIQELIDLRRESLAKLEEYSKALFLDMFGDPLESTKKWENKKLNELVVLKRWYDLPIQDRKKWDNPIIASSSIVWYHEEYKAKWPWIITGRSWTIWDVQIIESDYWPLNTTLYSQSLKWNNAIFVLHFLRYFRLDRYSRWAGVPTLNRNLFNEEIIWIPPFSLQQEFASRIEQVNALKSEYQLSLAKLSELYQATMQQYFS